MTKWLFAASVCACLSACGDHPSTDRIDSPRYPDAGQCWPKATSTPTGSVELGIGDSNTPFVAMPDDLALEYGTQGGFDVAIRARIHGLVPGNSTDITDPSNPRTLVHNEFLSTNTPTYDTPCPNRFGYTTDGADSATESAVMPALFFESLYAADLFGKQFRVVVEVIDMNGGYATAWKVVTVHAPPGWFMDAGM